MKKYLFFLFMTIFFLFSTKQQAFAHDLYDNAGGDSYGWKYRGVHASSTTQYYYPLFSNSQYHNYFLQGVQKIETETNNKFNLIETTSANTSNYVEDIECPTCQWVGLNTAWYDKSSSEPDHIIKWRIQLNMGQFAYSGWDTVSAHEIGHTFGLADLYNVGYGNELNLMWGEDTLYPRSVTTKDMNGFNWVY